MAGPCVEGALCGLQGPVWRVQGPVWQGPV
jgi:hypothetical protein